MADKPKKSGGIADIQSNSNTPRTISSDEIFDGQRLVIIRHGREDYRLQLTAADKLILTK